MAALSARVVADFFLNFAQEHGDLLTNLKLQKLVYYAQAWHLALHDTPLITEKIEGWVHGPVVSSLYGQFKKFRWDPITGAAAKPALPKATNDFLEEIYRVFSPFSAFQLECMTHQETPWINSRVGLSETANGRNEITHADMKDFYRKIAAMK